ncbi:MAG: hypothetical protein K0S58_3509, partial [Nitrospira sp.]|nr:hypothetical protein [Nitrospira sp.]
CARLQSDVSGHCSRRLYSISVSDFCNAPIPLWRAAGRIGIPGGCREAVPCRNSPIFKVHTKIGGNAGVSSDGRIEPHLHRSALILYFRFAHRRAEGEVYLIFRHPSHDRSAIDRPPYAIGIRRIFVSHEPSTFQVAARKHRNKNDQAGEKYTSCRHYKFPSRG